MFSSSWSVCRSLITKQKQQLVDLPWGVKQNDWNEKGKKRHWTTIKRLARNVSPLYEEISIHPCIFLYFWLCNQLRHRWMFFLPRWIFSVFFLLPYTFSHSSSAMWCCFYFLSNIGVTSLFFGPSWLFCLPRLIRFLIIEEVRSVT